MQVTTSKGKIDQYLEQEFIDISILRILAYFDIFQYPLTADEIRQFAGRGISEARMEQSLQQLLLSETIFTKNDFFSLHNNPLLAIKRKEGNRRAEKLLPKAITIGRFLYRFPFVRAVGISGSLSKNFADEKADIDFFYHYKGKPALDRQDNYAPVQKTHLPDGAPALFLYELFH